MEKRTKICFILKDLNENLKFSRYENSFLWLKNAGVALPTYNVEELPIGGGLTVYYHCIHIVSIIILAQRKQKHEIAPNNRVGKRLCPERIRCSVCFYVLLLLIWLCGGCVGFSAKVFCRLLKRHGAQSFTYYPCILWTGSKEWQEAWFANYGATNIHINLLGQDIMAIHSLGVVPVIALKVL
ncbi:MAG: hypothetical protein E7105_06120 [Prevotella sp.]|nr:hypothetical protein [Prevotella sp.]